MSTSPSSGQPPCEPVVAHPPLVQIQRWHAMHHAARPKGGDGLLPSLAPRRQRFHRLWLSRATCCGPPAPDRRDRRSSGAPDYRLAQLADENGERCLDLSQRSTQRSVVCCRGTFGLPETTKPNKFCCHRPVILLPHHLLGKIPATGPPHPPVSV